MVDKQVYAMFKIITFIAVEWTCVEIVQNSTSKG